MAGVTKLDPIICPRAHLYMHNHACGRADEVLTTGGCYKVSIRTIRKSPEATTSTSHHWLMRREGNMQSSGWTRATEM